MRKFWEAVTDTAAPEQAPRRRLVAALETINAGLANSAADPEFIALGQIRGLSLRLTDAVASERVATRTRDNEVRKMADLALALEGADYDAVRKAVSEVIAACQASR